MHTHIIITGHGPILAYTKMPQTIGPSRAAEPSPHAISSAACTINIVGYSFRKGHRISGQSVGRSTQSPLSHRASRVCRAHLGDEVGHRWRMFMAGTGDYGGLAQPGNL